MIKVDWRRGLRVLAVLAAVPAIGSAAEGPTGKNWPQWRGPEGNGVTHETGLALRWNERQGLAWKCALPEWGDSTPVIWQDSIFLTSHVDDRDLVLLKINKQSGTVAWTRTIGRAATPRAKPLHKSGDDRGQQKFHLTQNLATPSPVTNGKQVVVHFGNGDLAAFDFDGNRLWQRNLQSDFGKYSIWWGHANSPVLHADLVISICLQDSCRDFLEEPISSYVVAHDVQTGELRWKTLRMTDTTGEPCDAYTTPVFWQHGQQREMLVMGGQMIDAYDASSGQRLWWLPGLGGNRVIPSPVVAHGMVFAIQGMREPLIAVRPAGAGARPLEEIVWSSEKGTSDSPSPVVWGDLLFMVNNDGVLTCFDALKGRVLWKERLKGSYRASPLAAEGRLYLLNTSALCTVVAAASRFERLAENPLKDETIASPVVSDGRIYLRGRKSLYCIDRGKP